MLSRRAAWGPEEGGTQVCSFNNFVDIVHPLKVFMPVVFSLCRVVQSSPPPNSRTFLPLQKENHAHQR